MSYIFPYYLIEKDSRVAVYGFGRIGREFFWQMEKFGYCQCVMCVDKRFQYYENVERPFARVEELKKEKFDYVLIAIRDKETALAVKEDLKSLGVEERKIVWSENYEADCDIWPANKKRYLANPQFYRSIIEKYHRTDGTYGRRFYQSFTQLGIQGIRNTQERIALYRVKDFLKKTDIVLDIGCNCGFFDLQISPYVDRVIGMDIEPLFIEIARETKEYLGVTNADFQRSDYFLADPQEQYDAVFSLAVHTNIMVSGASEEEYVNRIMKNIKPGGYLFFESHNLLNDADRYAGLCKRFVESGMTICHRENYFSDFDRDITVLQRKS